MIADQRRANRLAWSIGAFTAACIIASLVLLALDWRVITDPFEAQLPWFLDGVITAALGVLIATRRPNNPIGWLLLAISAGNGINLICGFVAIRGLLNGASPQSWVEWPAWLFNWSGGAGAFLLMFLIFLFPDGRLPGPRWRRPLRVAIAVSVLQNAVGLLATGPQTMPAGLPTVPSPIDIPGLAGAWAGLAQTAVVVLGLAFTVAAVVVRFRRSTGDERRQLKWFAYAGGVAISVVLLSFPIGAVSSSLAGNVAGAAFDLGIGVVIPLTVGLAVIKYGLYDIDVFISRSIVYGSLAVLITAVYVGIAVGVGTLVGSGGKPNLALSILATAIVALGFQPVRERMERVANRLVYGQRATPYEVLSQFSERVASTYAADEVLPRMARVLKEGTAADTATVWLRAGDELHPAATFPEALNGVGALPLSGPALGAIPGASRSVEVRHHGELLGALSINKRRGETLTPIEAKLIDDLAGQAGLVLRNVGLTSALQARLEDLRASRQRLVTAQDEERRRLERDLHDGAQQHLVALKVKLGLAEMLMERDPTRARATIGQLKDDADEALATVRDLARGIYPPLLADKGLAAALESQARKATVPVAVQADGVDRHAQEIEAAVYFAVLEALQNVQKYAQASRVVVSICEEHGELRFTVEDDGCGFDVGATARGSGLTNMADRLDALAGELRITSSPGHGTVVEGRLRVPGADRGGSVRLRRAPSPCLPSLPATLPPAAPG